MPPAVVFQEHFGEELRLAVGSARAWHQRFIRSQFDRFVAGIHLPTAQIDQEDVVVCTDVKHVLTHHKCGAEGLVGGVRPRIREMNYGVYALLSCEQV